MKKKRFKAQQIVSILKEAERDGATAAEVSRAHGVSDATFYRWKKVYGGMAVPEARRLGQLEEENGVSVPRSTFFRGEGGISRSALGGRKHGARGTVTAVAMARAAR